MIEMDVCLLNIFITMGTRVRRGNIDFLDSEQTFLIIRLQIPSGVTASLATYPFQKLKKL